MFSIFITDPHAFILRLIGESFVLDCFGFICCCFFSPVDRFHLLLVCARNCENEDTLNPISFLRHSPKEEAMASDQPTICLEMPIVHGLGVGRTLFMDGVNDATTLSDLETWIRCQVPTNKQVVAVDVHMGDHGVLLNVAGDYSNVMDYLCYDEPVPVRIWEAEKGGFVTVVENQSGKRIHMPYVDNMSVEMLKLLIEAKEGIPMDQQRIIFAGKLLSHCSLLMDNNIRSGDTVHLVLRLCGGGGSGRPFVDVTKNRMKKMHWSKTAPDWRTAEPGLSLEGSCENKKCPAFKKMVIMNFGYTNVDLIGNPMTLTQCKCPVCWSNVTPLVPAFNNCFYRIAARKTGSTTLFQKPWSRCDDFYYTYDLDKCGQATFCHIQIFVRPLEMDEEKGNSPVPYKCAICFDTLEKSYDLPCDKICKLPNCNHYFHKSCAKEWAERGGNCPCCRMPMTN